MWGAASQPYIMVVSHTPSPGACREWQFNFSFFLFIYFFLNGSHLGSAGVIKLHLIINRKKHCWDLKS